ncbi:retrovirus-related pol polyprotein from transposon TNT 1-94 [Tanacetum coccineum]
MTTPITTSTIDSKMHNNIMAAGSRDRPPMLATGRYAQWRSWFLRYIDTRPNGDALRKCILKGPYTPTIVTTPAVPATEDSPALKKCGKSSKGYNKKMMNEMIRNNLTVATISHATTRYKGKEIAKPITPPSESASEEDSDPEQAQKDKDMHKNLLLNANYSRNSQTTNNNLRTSSNTRKQEMWILLQGTRIDNQTDSLESEAVNVVGARETVGGLVVQQSGIQCFNCKEFGHYAKECRKPKRVKDSTYHKEKMLLCKQAEKGVQLQAEQSDWLADTDEEIDEQELEAHYSYMAKIQEVPNADSSTDAEPLEQVQYDTDDNVFANDIQHFDQSESISNTCVVETGDSNVIPDSPDMCDNDIQDDQNDVEFVKEKHDIHQTESFNKSHYEGLVKKNSSISLKIALQECQEQLKNDTVCKEKASNVFQKEREQYFEIQDLKAQLQDKNIAISELKKLIEKCKGKSVDTKFDKPSVVQQPNAQRDSKTTVLGKPLHFQDSLERKYFAKKKSVLKTNESEGLSKPVTPQNLPQTTMQAVRNTNVIKPGMYRIASSTTQTRAPQLNQTSRNTNPRVSTSTGVAHKTNVSRPQPRSNQMKDKVVPNTSHVKFKKTEVEEHPRISSISNQTKSVTACNDSLNSRTSNVNAVCATCGKCVFNSNHDACVSKFLKDVNARTKKPNVVPISTRKPKSQANKSVATPHKKTVASESTITNSKSYYRMLYKKTSKAWKWWIAQQCPSAYT